VLEPGRQGEVVAGRRGIGIDAAIQWNGRERIFVLRDDR